MIPVSIFGMFCEDIRLEKNDIVTLIGLMPDNIRVQPVTADQENNDGVEVDQRRLLNKLCVYARANFDPDDPIKEIEFKLVLPNNEEVRVGSASSEIVEIAKNQAKKNGNPLAGVVTRSMLHFTISGAGIIRLDAIVGTERRTIAALNLREAENSSSPNESEQPA